jgi:hypothetical protein
MTAVVKDIAGPLISYGVSMVIIGILSSIALARYMEGSEEKDNTLTGTLSAVVGVSGLGIIVMIATSAKMAKRRRELQRFGMPSQQRQRQMQNQSYFA